MKSPSAELLVTTTGTGKFWSSLSDVITELATKINNKNKCWGIKIMHNIIFIVFLVFSILTCMGIIIKIIHLVTLFKANKKLNKKDKNIPFELSGTDFGSTDRSDWILRLNSCLSHLRGDNLYFRIAK